MENDERAQKIQERLKYRPYERCANRVGVLMIIQQTVFQIGAIVVLFILLIFEGIGRKGFDLEKLYRMIAKPGNVLFDVYLASAIMQLVAGICFLVFFLLNKDAIIHAPLSGGGMSFGLMIKCFLVILAVNAVITSVSTLIGGSSASNVNMVADKRFAGLFILIAVFPAIVEELFYRGVLFRYLRRGGFGYAAVISSLVFGMVHMNVTQLVFAGIMGFVLCYLYEKTGHIWSGMILHFANNALVILLSQFADSKPYKIIVCIAGAAALAALIVSYFVKFRHIEIGDRKAITKGLTTVGMVFFLVFGAFICIAQLLV